MYGEAVIVKTGLPYISSLHLLLLQVTVIDTNTQFIEHVIFIMKSVFENRVDHTTEHLGVTSIEAMMLTIVRWVRS